MYEILGSCRGSQPRSSLQFSYVKVKKGLQCTHVGVWLLGGGWSEADWGGALPDASWLDDVRAGGAAILLLG